jgi:23S rRNA (guanosine2251-2'-O)-methyltransferase
MHIDSLIIHDIRSTHNVGSILRTCDGFGVRRVYIGGISPYPRVPDDVRLPHIITKLTKDIHKTALGAEETIEIILYSDIFDLIEKLTAASIQVIALEQTPSSLPISKLVLTSPASILLGREVDGIEPPILTHCALAVEIPMQGKKESFNVSVATGIALYALCT